ncbi:MAG: hypothetical protein ABI162_16625 [Luteolibacter sp.]
MKFPTVVIFTGLSCLEWIAAAVPKSTAPAPVEAPAKSLESLVRELADQNFQVREKATREIWKAGEKALPMLQEASEAEDPEQAYRARDLVRKIELSITPETDPVVLVLVDRYARASTNDKLDLLSQMAKKHAWRQILKLYATDKNPELRSRFQDSAKEYAVLAARECLLEDKADTARDFLEMAPADSAGLMALADFHRSQGTLETELKRARGLKGENAEAWQLALYRAAGNLEAARDSATAAGELEISAAMSVLLGDPLPWLRSEHARNGDNAIQKTYSALAIKRWQGKEIRQADLESITRALGNRDPSNHQEAINALFLLGETKLAEAALVKNSSIGAFVHFETLERIPEALKALNLDPENPDYATWVATRMEHLSKDQADDEHENSEDTRQLALMANFLESRGLIREENAAFLKPMTELAKKDVSAFTEFLSVLFGKRAMNGAPLLAKRIGIEWAGEDAVRWAELVSAAIGEDDETKEWWDWLGELDPKASQIERFDGLLALFDIGSDPKKLREKWLALAWEAVDHAPAEKQVAMNGRIFAITARGNVSEALKAWDRLPPENRNRIFWEVTFLNLSAAGRWDEAAGFFIRLIGRINEVKQEPRPDFYAFAAGCLRQAGKQAEAATYDAWADKLVLGNTEFASRISSAYAFCRDNKRAEAWRNRAIQECDPESGGLFFHEQFAWSDPEAAPQAIQMLADNLLEQGEWKRAAAIYEVLAQESSSNEPRQVGVMLLRQRMQADMALALANLKNNRAGSIAILEKCHGLFPSDGSLADTFFPSLRKAGLMTEHDKWFNLSWDLITDVIRHYPASDNTCNTAGWLASRARLNLDLAENYLQKALAMNPEQAAYLDTMGEIQFAKGNRNKALEWSQLAINFTPQDAQLRHQHERFRSEPIPR